MQKRYPQLRFYKHPINIVKGWITYFLKKIDSFSKKCLAVPRIKHLWSIEELSKFCLVVLLSNFFPLILWITVENRTKLKKLFTWTIIYGTWFLHYFWLQEFIQQQTLKLMNKQKISVGQQIHSSSEEFLKEKLKTFNGIYSLLPWFNMQILDLCRSWHRRIHNLFCFCLPRYWIYLLQNYFSSYSYLKNIYKTLKRIGKIQFVSQLTILPNQFY